MNDKIFVEFRILIQLLLTLEDLETAKSENKLIQVNCNAEEEITNS
jgi:hypothetical protein